MYFLLQKERNGFDIDVMVFKNILDRNRFLHEYQPYSLDDFYYFDTDEHGNIVSKKLLTKDSFPSYIASSIPVGTIDFVSTFLRIFHGIEKENPIEIPPCLRTDEFLKRKYSIRAKDEIPTEGRYFIKDASELKVFSYTGDMQNLLHKNIWLPPTSTFDSELHLNPEHLYQVSEEVEILSEYRAYFISGEPQAVANYNGNPLIFPDAELIKKADMIYSTQPDYPKSYTMDVAISNKGTFILEIHPLICFMYSI